MLWSGVVTNTTSNHHRCYRSTRVSRLVPRALFGFRFRQVRQFYNVEGISGMPEVTRGTVKWFNNAKGYGFIQREEGADVFVHHTDISMDGYRTLEEGERVEFVLVEAEKGPRAQEVRRLDASP